MVDWLLEFAVRQPGFDLVFDRCKRVHISFLNKPGKPLLQARRWKLTRSSRLCSEERKKRILQLNQTPLSLRYIITTGRHSACCRSRKDQQKDKYLLQLRLFFLRWQIQKLFQGAVVLLRFLLIMLFLRLKKVQRRKKKRMKTNVIIHLVSL